jgi:hypothetical protein
MVTIDHELIFKDVALACVHLCFKAIQCHLSLAYHTSLLGTCGMAQLFGAMLLYHFSYHRAHPLPLFGTRNLSDM